MYTFRPRWWFISFAVAAGFLLQKDPWLGIAFGIAALVLVIAWDRRERIRSFFR